MPLIELIIEFLPHGVCGIAHIRGAGNVPACFKPSIGRILRDCHSAGDAREIPGGLFDRKRADRDRFGHHGAAGTFRPSKRKC